MSNIDMYRRQMDLTYSEINYLIRLLYATNDQETKNLTLNQLWNKFSHLQFINQLLYNECFQSHMSTPTTLQASQPSIPEAITQQNQTNTPQIEITREQLSEFTGMNGKPAYVAVDEIIYDVTNNAAWSVASHFGLTAGEDLSQEFASCHTGQQWILETLPPVGRLIT
ncbi:cytochrome b5 [Thalassobacillus hwangdonensis]|uniref:Cytochrome b5 n=1 Tax=Thalassobacillus hwangdonensis TaxID=546108 RepID=A0ABW3KWX7_9BACI